MNDMDFTDKTALIVGGSSGIGNGVAQNFRARGADVHVWGTRKSASDYSAADGSDLEGLTYSCVDVSKFDQIDAAKPTFESLDILVLCQGLVRYGKAEFERAGWDEVMNVNLNSVMDCSRKFHPMLKESAGSLIIMSSVVAFRSSMGNPAYVASKAGAAALTATLGEAWARDGIRVNGIAPGYVETKLTAVTSENEKRHDMMVKSIPLRRSGTPSEIAGAALFLASPLASYVVGQTLVVDGGMILS
ncbi:SDR family NAD(P)-dependent oxidoreductase [Hellea balneolensis]|uniref:SDR family NAD(P)-dependent oxidoreductase n=1 Tax=Hellea balneolensis TaxID=287478 RepID=UPI0003FAD451|nr:SDR family oxidoreductase [Hellea balneolensis]